ncbi:hypothetical protein DAI22_12g198000 [Oryza sativa Japonica Group]|nr:hypothetical protein DAI22_12g198000 [Oryza sativa Japonica Group]
MRLPPRASVCSGGRNPSAQGSGGGGEGERAARSRRRGRAHGAEVAARARAARSWRPPRARRARGGGGRGRAGGDGCRVEGQPTPAPRRCRRSQLFHAEAAAPSDELSGWRARRGRRLEAGRKEEFVGNGGNPINVTCASFVKILSKCY